MENIIIQGKTYKLVLVEEEKKPKYDVGQEIYVNGKWHRVDDVVTLDHVVYETENGSFDQCQINHEKTAEGSKKEVKSWEDLGEVEGWYVTNLSNVEESKWGAIEQNKKMRATKEQAECSIILAQLSQLIKRHKQEGGVTLPEQLINSISPIVSLLDDIKSLTS